METFQSTRQHSFNADFSRNFLKVTCQVCIEPVLMVLQLNGDLVKNCAKEASKNRTCVMRSIKMMIMYIYDIYVCNIKHVIPLYCTHVSISLRNMLEWPYSSVIVTVRKSGGQ